MAEPLVRVVSIVSTSYSGSTWLNLLLGSHSEAFSVGEFKSLRKHGRIACMLDGEDCPFWKRFDLDSDEDPYLQLHRLTGKRYLITTNSLRYFPVAADPRIDHRIIHFMRDGRVVAASIVRKGDERNYYKATLNWRRNVLRNERMLRRMPDTPQTLRHYEKVADDSEAQLRELCEFLGMTFEPTMLEYWNREHHYLAGNRGTLFSMAAQKNQQLPDDPRLKGTDKAGPNWDLDYYKQADTRRFRDERWRQQLKPWHYRLFSILAGRINARYGYPRGAQ